MTEQGSSDTGATPAVVSTRGVQPPPLPRFDFRTRSSPLPYGGTRATGCPVLLPSSWPSVVSLWMPRPSSIGYNDARHSIRRGRDHSSCAGSGYPSRRRRTGTLPPSSRHYQIPLPTPRHIRQLEPRHPAHRCAQQPIAENGVHPPLPGPCSATPPAPAAAHDRRRPLAPPRACRLRCRRGGAWTALGDAAFVAAWKEGQALAVEAAVAMVLEVETGVTSAQDDRSGHHEGPTPER